MSATSPNNASQPSSVNSAPESKEKASSNTNAKWKLDTISSDVFSEALLPYCSAQDIASLGPVNKSVNQEVKNVIDPIKSKL